MLMRSIKIKYIEIDAINLKNLKSSRLTHILTQKKVNIQNLNLTTFILLIYFILVAILFLVCLKKKSKNQNMNQHGHQRRHSLTLM